MPTKTGKISSWNDKRGFGFITSENETKDLFIHISALKDMSRRPIIGDIIHFQVQTDSSGKKQAINAIIEGVRVVNKKLIKLGNIFNSVVAAILCLVFLVLLGFELSKNFNQINLHSIFPFLNTSKIKTSSSKTNNLINNLYKRRQSNVQVSGIGIVAKLLRDDTQRPRHQKFILKLANSQTLLVAHNIDLAQRINTLKLGDYVSFYGEYEWNYKGGIIHWTHKDPRNVHINGWLKHHGIIYQ